MQIVNEQITQAQLKEMAASLFGDMVKGVVDVERGILALHAELHADLEALLLREGSRQSELWGINLYPDLAGDDFLEFDSLINVKPAQGNRSRTVEDEGTRGKIRMLVSQRVKR